MSNNFNLAELIRLSEKGNQQIKLEMQKFDLVIDQLIKNVPSDQIATMEKVKALSKKAIELHKQGKIQEGNEVIEQLKNLNNGN